MWLSILLAVLTLGGVLASALFLRKTGREARISAVFEQPDDLASAADVAEEGDI